MNTPPTMIAQHPDYVPLAMLNALAYCPRRFAYEFILKWTPSGGPSADEGSPGVVGLWAVDAVFVV